MTKVTVNLTPASMDCLAQSAALNDDTRTETVNRALQLYAAATSMHVGELLRVDDALLLARTSDARRVRAVLLGVLLIVLAFVAGVVSPW